MLQPGGVQEGRPQAEDAATHARADPDAHRRHARPHRVADDGLSHRQPRAVRVSHGAGADHRPRAAADGVSERAPDGLTDDATSYRPSDVRAVPGRSLLKQGALPLKPGLLRAGKVLLQREVDLDRELRHADEAAGVSRADHDLSFCDSIYF